ncbi:hypothetical protein HYDPIDRAFT_118054 [Hydnomerulius pinastri MD-312]|uniref:PHD-type domain-containing protein n=1 Tax=Hydnomerulius pinastri MD-312 TaxID=994086 RepID=A0A0C9W9A6_9AGAM|nr:hypothetical protein HYDPIDRAFT_118054 [Hydnomerulius pinastri MD-312]
MPSEDINIAENSTEGGGAVSSAFPVITPSKSNQRGPLVDLSGWPSYSEMHTQAPGGGSSGGTHESGGFSSDTPLAVNRSLPVFLRPSHLPTPQSPGNMSSYLLSTSQTPGSSSSLQSPSPPPPFRPHQILTPESSPLVARSRGNGSHVLSQSMQKNGHDRIVTTPSKRKSSQSRESTPSQRIPTRPITPTSIDAFPLQVDVAATALQRTPTQRSSPEPLSHLPNSLPSPSQTARSPSQKATDEAGGEIARIRAELMENHLVLTQEAESRRPDYFKRAKRSAQDPSETGAGVALSEAMDGSMALQPAATIGVTVSPIKGRRITLFQETSDESFEESLMAGGYGRYRSDGPYRRVDEGEAPIRVNDAGEDGSVVSEQEKRKKSRLAAFFESPQASSSKAQLFPVEIEGRGRVLVNLDPAEPQTPLKPTPSKAKRSRKKKKPATIVQEELDSVIPSSETRIDAPNWPDTQFPWRSRSTQQDGYWKAEREERRRYIESFLDRDSDEDDAEESPSSPSLSLVEGALPSHRPGQGKMYPLVSHSRDRRYGPTTISVVPSDPADARTALLSKKSIRAFTLRRLRRKNSGEDSDGNETVCVCKGQDDGRELVQCDACRTWYHLECIGIQSTSELGREEDPWFCANCVEVKTPPPVVSMPLSEPTFVPTDEKVRLDEGYDPPFFHAGLNPSPATPWTRTTRPPTTPPRSNPGPYFSSGSSWDEPSSRGGPRTPQLPSRDAVRVYKTTVTPGRVVEPLTLDESPFDPTSTPSRGIKFGAPFATPKDSLLWSSKGRAQDLFHTPTRPGEGGASSRHFAHQQGGYQQHPSRVGEGDMSLLPFTSSGHSVINEFTPIGRNVNGPGRLLESPLAAKRSRRLVDVRASPSREDSKQGVRRS